MPEHRPTHTEAFTQTETLSNQTDVDPSIEKIARRFQETIITTINSLNRDEDGINTDLKTGVNKISAIEAKLDIKDRVIELEDKLKVTERISALEERMNDFNCFKEDMSKVMRNQQQLQSSMKQSIDTLDHVCSELGTVKPQKYKYNVHDVNSTGELMNTEQKIYKEMREIQKQLDNLREEQKKLSEDLKSTSEAQSESTKRLYELSHLVDQQRITPCDDQKLYYACSVKNRFVELDNIVISDEIENTKTNPISSLKEIKGSPKIKQVKTKVPPREQNIENTNTYLTSRSNEAKGPPRQVKTKVPPREQNAKIGGQNQTINNSDNRKSVLMIGNSYFKPIVTRNFLRGHSVKKLICFTVDEVDTFMDSCTNSFDCILLNLLTAELKKCGSVETFCRKFENLVERVHTKWPDAVVVISLGICRADSEKLNEKLQECNILLQHKYLHSKFIYLCDNSSLGIRGQPNARFLKFDKVHLKKQGTKVFVCNLKF